MNDHATRVMIAGEGQKLQSLYPISNRVRVQLVNLAILTSDQEGVDRSNSSALLS